MSAGDVLKAEETGEMPENADDLAVSAAEKTDVPAPEAAGVSLEDQEDDAWIDACRTEGTSLADDDTANGAEPADENDRNSDTEPSAEDEQDDALLAENSRRIAAMEETGTEATSKLGQAMGVIAERIDDLEDLAQEGVFDRTAESSGKSAARGDVAPYIENAERELEASKASGPMDIFDRIAQAAESQFDESRGSTAQRVSKLVDDRRVGTKKWTPSKTVKKRMEKLEAARLAAETDAEAAKSKIESPAETAETPETASGTAAAAVQAPQPTPEPVAEKPDVEEKIVISRRDKQHLADEEAADAASVSEDTASGPDDHIDPEDEDAALRIIPGARGRRRDRARKSRLDEDFEKIFEGEEGKPSIGSLRRKLRVGSAQQDEPADVAREEATVTDEPSTTEEVFGAEAEAEAPATPQKAGFFSRLFKRNPKPAPVADEGAPEAEAETEAMVDAFEADEKDDAPSLDFDATGTQDDEWDQINSEDREPTERRTSNVLIVGAVLVAATGVGVFIYRAFLGG